MMELNRLAKLAGLKLSESDMDYRGSHQAPSMEENAPLYDMTMNGIYPADIYGPDGIRYYGDGMRYDNESMYVIRSVHNRPTAKVKMYRAVPKFQTNQEKIVELRTDMASFLRRGNVPSKYSNMPLKGSAWYNWAYDEIKRLEALPVLRRCGASWGRNQHGYQLFDSHLLHFKIHCTLRHIKKDIYQLGIY